MKYASVHVSLGAEMKGVFVSVELSSKIGGVKEIDFYRAGSSPVESELLCLKLQKQLQAMMEHVRKCAYLKGWKDKASHKVKKDEWFSGAAGVKEWEEKEAGL
jgi:hypothetical protein